jgi:polyisoprenoid-binding protein YceI
MARSGRRVAALFTLLFCGCAGPSPSRPSPSASVAVASAAEKQASTLYHIDAAQSDVRMLVYRTGALAGLGHNHVISATDLDGVVYLHPERSRSSFELSVPVTALVVDDPRLRREEGEAFESEPSAADIAGTKSNLVSARVLDAAEFPAVHVAGRLEDDAGESPQLDVFLTVRDRTVELAVPITLAVNAESLLVAGEFTVTHAELGLDPYSVMLGALQVADPIDLKFRLRAIRQTEKGPG